MIATETFGETWHGVTGTAVHQLCRFSSSLNDLAFRGHPAGTCLFLPIDVFGDGVLWMAKLSWMVAKHWCLVPGKETYERKPWPEALRQMRARTALAEDGA